MSTLSQSDCQNYQRSIQVTANTDQAYAALTHGIEHWWTVPDKPIHQVGDQAKFTFPPGLSYWTFEATELVTSSKVELTCVGALHIHQGQPKAIETEWLDTKAVFIIEPNTHGCTIHFTHIGLQPSLLCYDICREGWDFFFLDSLQTYLDTGTGKPHRA